MKSTLTSNVIKIHVLKLEAQYSSGFHFKVKVGIKKFDKECETTDSFKFEKTFSELAINKIIELKFEENLSADVTVNAFLQVYTKTGYKTAGMGIIDINSIFNNEKDVKVEILKCPLGKGRFHFSFEYTPKTKEIPQKIPKEIPQQKSQENSIRETLHDQNVNKEEIKKLSTLVKDKDKIIQDLKSKIKYFEDENNEMKVIVNDIKNEKKKALDEKNEMIRQQRDEITSLTDKISKYENDLTTITTELNEQKNLNDLASKEQKDMKTQKDSQLVSLQNELKKLSQEKKDVEQLISEKEELLEDAKNNLSKINEELSSEKQKISEMEIQLDKAKTELSLQKEENSNIVENFKKELAAKESEIDTLTETLNDMKSSANQTQNDSQEQITQLRLKLKEKENELMTKETENMRLTTELSQMQSDLTMQKEESYTVSKSSEKKLKDDLIKIRSALDNLKTENSKLTSEIYNLKAENDKYKKELKNAETNQVSNDAFFIQLQEMQKNFTERENKITKEKNEEICSLKKEIEGFKQNSKNTSAGDVTKYLNEIKRITEQKSSIEEDLKYYKELNMRFVDTEKKATQLEIENANIRSMLSEKENENNDIKKEKRQLLLEKDELEKDLMKSKEKIGELLNEIAELEGVTLNETKNDRK